MSAREGLSDLTRPIIGIENRTAQEAFDIMADRIRSALRSEPRPSTERGEFSGAPSSTISEGLRPCPFCGGEAHLRYVGESTDETGEVDGGYHDVGCKTCNGGNRENDVYRFIGVHGDTKAETIAAWNRRAPNPTPPADLGDFVLVPREPTEGMARAVLERTWLGEEPFDVKWEDVAEVLRVMIAAAPAKAPAELAGVSGEAWEAAREIADTDAPDSALLSDAPYAGLTFGQLRAILSLCTEARRPLVEALEAMVREFQGLAITADETDAIDQARAALASHPIGGGGQEDMASRNPQDRGCGHPIKGGPDSQQGGAQ